MFQHLDESKHSDRLCGFTLIEALVALTILTVGLIPAFQQATAAVRLSTSIRNSLIAGTLAQEGVEVVRALRDANWFTGAPSFDVGLTTCASGCRVQSDTGVASGGVLSLGTNPPLKIDPLSGLYQYSAGTDTLFHRKITITPSNPHKLYVQSEITWVERTTPKTLSIEYYLFDWIK